MYFIVTLLYNKVQVKAKPNGIILEESASSFFICSACLQADLPGRPITTVHVMCSGCDWTEERPMGAPLRHFMNQVGCRWCVTRSIALIGYRSIQLCPETIYGWHLFITPLGKTNREVPDWYPFANCLAMSGYCTAIAYYLDYVQKVQLCYFSPLIKFSFGCFKVTIDNLQKNAKGETVWVQTYCRAN